MFMMESKKRHLGKVNKPVGISGYATRLTEFLLPVRCTQTGLKKLKGLLRSPEEIEAQLSRRDEENSGV